MDVLNELAEKAQRGLEKENLVVFMRSFCHELVEAGDEISERDKPVKEAFEQVYEAVCAVEEKTKQLLEGGSATPDDVNDAKRRMGELRRSLDNLQTSAISNPALLPFARQVAMHARAMSEPLEQLAKVELEQDINKLYDQFNSV